jgi:hypothetical protein
MGDDLAVALAGARDRERALGRLYRQQILAAWGPRVRRLWEEGWAIKQHHDDVLTRVLASSTNTPAAVAAVPPVEPSPREVLSWVYGQEQLLGLGYRESVRLALDPDTHRVLTCLAEEQDQLLAKVRETYRDYSAA